jgi:hypothetical protein
MFFIVNYALKRIKRVRILFGVAFFLMVPCLLIRGQQTNQNTMVISNEFGPTNGIVKVRPEIKQYLDELASFQLVGLEHTTDSIVPPPARHNPAIPAEFDAGRFRVLFVKGGERRVLICQTEAVVGHYARVTPGKTKVGGFVEILDDPASDEGPGRKLSIGELDYFVQGIYQRFSKPLTDEQAALLNRIKDYSLAVLFSGRKGIEEYHLGLVKQLVR